MQKIFYHRVGSCLRSCRAPLYSPKWSCKHYTNQQVSKPKITVLYGSQTGTAENFAKDMGKKARKNQFECKVVDLADYDHSNEFNKEDAVVVIASCYGEGEPTDSAKPFYTWLMSQNNTNLANMRFSVFGLGNSATHCERYNVVGKNIDKKLEELNGVRIFKRGDGDDSADIEEDFESWQDAFWEDLKQKFIQNSQKASQIPDPTHGNGIVRLFEAVKHTPDEECKYVFVPNKPIDIKNPVKVPVLINQEISKSDRSCKFIVLDLANTQVSYETGDHVGIMAKNELSVVEEAAKVLHNGWENMDQVFSFKPTKDNSDGKSPFPGPLSLRNALLYNVDLTSPAQKSFIAVCESLAMSQSDKTLITRLLSDKEFYQSYIINDQRRPMDLLKELTSVKMDWDLFLENCPRLQPRYYSIASSHLKSPNQIDMIIRQLSWTTRIGRHANGVCSTYLSNLKTDEQVLLWPRKTRFTPPNDCQTPIIMLGAGTGLAPFIGFIEHRKCLLNEGAKLGPAYLFTGFRNKKEFICSEMIKDAKAIQAITDYHVAFSHEGQPELVSDQLYNEAETIWNLIQNEGAVIYVCGGASGFGPSIFSTFKKIIMRMKTDRDEAGSQQDMMEIMNQGRYMEDLAD